MRLAAWAINFPLGAADIGGYQLKSNAFPGQAFSVKLGYPAAKAAFGHLRGTQPCGLRIKPTATPLKAVYSKPACKGNPPPTKVTNLANLLLKLRFIFGRNTFFPNKRRWPATREVSTIFSRRPKVRGMTASTGLPTLSRFHQPKFFHETPLQLGRRKSLAKPSSDRKGGGTWNTRRTLGRGPPLAKTSGNRGGSSPRALRQVRPLKRRCLGILVSRRGGVRS